MRSLSVFGLTALVIVALAQPAAAARMEDWTNAEGKTFQGEPAGIVGPYAMFRTSKKSTTGVRLRSMTAADCVRYYEATRSLPARAADWAEADSKLSKEIFEYAYVLKDEKIVRADLHGRIEPELYLLICGWHDHGDSWDAFGVIRPVYERLRAAYPDVFEAVFLGVKHDGAKNRRMIAEAHMPWLVTNLEDERAMNVAKQFLPAEPPTVVVLTRHGDLIYNSGQPKKGAIEKVLGDLEALLVQMKPNSARTAVDRKSYLSAIQTTAFRTGRCDPVLVASPLDVDGLRQAGLQRVDATIVVGSDHAVKNVEVSDNGGKLSAEWVEAISAALGKALFVAAVENGQFVEATYEMHLNLAQ